jgi:hypothetical protein
MESLGLGETPKIKSLLLSTRVEDQRCSQNPQGFRVLIFCAWSRDREHDALLSLMAWVENDLAPDHIIPTKWKNDTDPSQGVLRQRPICKFPAQAQYAGHGDVDASSSWSCVAPA